MVMRDPVSRNNVENNSAPQCTCVYPHEHVHTPHTICIYINTHIYVHIYVCIHTQLLYWATIIKTDWLALDSRNVCLTVVGTSSLR